MIRKVDDNWLEGKKGDRIGIFPLSFVQVCYRVIVLYYSQISLLTIYWFVLFIILYPGTHIECSTVYLSHYRSA